MTTPSLDDRYDAVIVGASIAGCTTAIQLGRAGLRIALVDRVRRPDAYKALCGHWILGGTQPTLHRLGLWEPMIAAGAQASSVDLWVEGDWITRPDGEVPPGIGIRRQELDPLLRSIAAGTPGVDLLLGHAAIGIVEEDDRVVGVQVAAGDDVIDLRGRLVIAADGHHSAVGRLAGVPEDRAPNERFFFWSYYRNVTFPGRGPALLWRDVPSTTVVVPAGNGLTLAGCFYPKDRLGEFESDRRDAIERSIADLPDAPDLRRSEAVGRPVGTTDYPLIRRSPAPRPGLAMVGDAALASDPLPAVGCGWAFRSAEALADAVSPALCSDADEATVDASLTTYAEAHRFIQAYDDLSRTEARAEAPDPAQRAVARLAHHDADVARRMLLFGMRADSPSVLLNADVMAKAAALA